MGTRSGAATVLRNYRGWAARRGLAFELTADEFLAIAAQACRYCGAPPSNTIKRGKPSAFTYNGVDRLDNALGYTLANAVPCCKTCNWAKQRMSVGEFTEWVGRVHAKLFGSHPGGTPPGV